MTAEDLIAAMDLAGVDAAMLVTPGLYGFDNSYALGAAGRWPDRLAVVARWDPGFRDIESVRAQWRNWPPLVGLRVALATDDDVTDLMHGALTHLFLAAQKHGIPVCLGSSGKYLSEIGILAKRHGGVQFIIDHLGLPQYPWPIDSPPFHRLEDLLALASTRNVAVKATGVPMLSLEPYPFPDIWPALDRIFDAFTLDRVIWGSDFTRCAHHHTYSEGVGYLRAAGKLTKSELDQVMRASLCRIFSWSPSFRREGTAPPNSP